MLGGAGNDSLSGGGGVDELSYVGETAGVFVNLGFPAISNTTDTVAADFENLRGGSGDDVLLGDGAANLIWGEAGDDQAAGGGGDDSLSGGAGNDLLEGSQGSDTLEGGAGADTLNAAVFDEGLRDIVELCRLRRRGARAARRIGQRHRRGRRRRGRQPQGVDALLGSVGADTLAGRDLDGADGADQLRGTAGADTLRGGVGNDTIEGGAGGDSLSGGDGVDELSYAGDTAGVKVGLLFAEALNGDAAGDTFAADFENLRGGGGNDSCSATRPRT